MNKIIFLSFFSSLILFSACKKDDGHSTDPQYQIQIMSPNMDDKKVNDEIHIHVEFESQAEETIHHINVRIYNADDGTEIYNMPSDAHIHASASHGHHDDFVLSNVNGVTAHSNWVIEAKVWGHEAGLHEVSERVNFHVHPE